MQRVCKQAQPAFAAMLLAATAQAAPGWWEESSAPILADLSMGACVSVGSEHDGFTVLPEPWRLEKGAMVMTDAGPPAGQSDDDLVLLGSKAKSRVSDGSAIALKAIEPVILSVGSDEWVEYAVSAEIMLGTGKPITLAGMAGGKSAHARRPRPRALVRALRA